MSTSGQYVACVASGGVLLMYDLYSVVMEKLLDDILDPKLRERFIKQDPTLSSLMELYKSQGLVRGNVNTSSLSNLMVEPTEFMHDRTKGMSCWPSAMMTTTSRPVERATKHVTINVSPTKMSDRRAPLHAAQLPDDAVLNNLSRLVHVLETTGAYPDQHRLLIWRFLLRLPENSHAFSALVSRGTHPALEDLHKRFPLRDARIGRRLFRVMNVLGHWCPLCAASPILPVLVYPFVKLFDVNDLACFETVITILFNWCYEWFSFFPSPPITVLNAIERMLAHTDPRLLAHFVKRKITSQVYAWTLLSTLYTEVLPRDAWLILWDHILTNPPQFFYCFLIAYLCHFKYALLSMTTSSEIENFLRTSSPCNIHDIISLAHKVMQRSNIAIPGVGSELRRLPVVIGSYPPFTSYPKLEVNYSIEIATSAKDAIKRRQAQLDIESKLTSQPLLDMERDMSRDIDDDRHRMMRSVRAEGRLADAQLQDAIRLHQLLALKEAREAGTKAIDSNMIEQSVQELDSSMLYEQENLRDKAHDNRITKLESIMEQLGKYSGEKNVEADLLRSKGPSGDGDVKQQQQAKTELKPTPTPKQQEPSQVPENQKSDDDDQGMIEEELLDNRMKEDAELRNLEDDLTVKISSWSGDHQEWMRLYNELRAKQAELLQRSLAQTREMNGLLAKYPSISHGVMSDHRSRLTTMFNEHSEILEDLRRRLSKSMPSNIRQTDLDKTDRLGTRRMNDIQRSVGQEQSRLEMNLSTRSRSVSDDRYLRMPDGRHPLTRVLVPNL